jgi:hypothetical protein
MNTKFLLALLQANKMLPGDLAVFGWTAERIRNQQGQVYSRCSALPILLRGLLRFCLRLNSQTTVAW